LHLVILNYYLLHKLNEICVDNNSKNDNINVHFQIEEEAPTFRPFTRESLAKIEARLEEVNEKKRELDRKRAEGEVITDYSKAYDIFDRLLNIAGKLVILYNYRIVSDNKLCFEYYLKRVL
jgi:hypothetical protein